MSDAEVQVFGRLLIASEPLQLQKTTHHAREATEKLTTTMEMNTLVQVEIFQVTALAFGVGVHSDKKYYRGESNTHLDPTEPLSAIHHRKPTSRGVLLLYCHYCNLLLFPKKDKLYKISVSTGKMAYSVQPPKKTRKFEGINE